MTAEATGRRPMTDARSVDHEQFPGRRRDSGVGHTVGRWRPHRATTARR